VLPRPPARATLMLLMLLTVPLTAAWWMLPSLPRRPSRPLTTEDIRQLAALATAELQFSDSVAVETRGWFGGLDLLLDARGHALLGTDLDRAVLSDVDPENGTATLTLPPPKLLSVAVNAARTRTAYVSAWGLWSVSPAYEPARTRLLQRAWQEAENRFRNAAGSAENLQTARRHAEDVLHRFAAAQGWTLTIEWAGS